MEKCLKEGEIATLKAEMKTAFKKIDALDKIYNVIYQMSANIAILAEQMKDLRKDMDSVKKDVDEIKQQPADNWRKLTFTVVSVVVTTAIGFMMGKLL